MLEPCTNMFMILWRATQTWFRAVIVMGNTFLTGESWILHQVNYVAAWLPWRWRLPLANHAYVRVHVYVYVHWWQFLHNFAHVYTTYTCTHVCNWHTYIRVAIPCKCTCKSRRLTLSCRDNTARFQRCQADIILCCGAVIGIMQIQMRLLPVFSCTS